MAKAKVFAASCVAGIVTCEGVAVECEILSEGIGESEGILLVDGDKAFYVASSALDLKATIVKLTAMIQQVILITTALDAVTVSPGSAAALITQLTLLKTEFDLTKDLLI